MAQAITKIAPSREQADNRREKELEELQELAADHTGELRQILHLARLLRERGLTDAAVALLEKGPDLLEILVDQASKPGAVGGVKNTLALIQGLGQLDSRVVTAAAGGLSQASDAIAEGRTEPVRGPWSLLRKLRDPDVLAGLSALFAIIQSIGRQLRSASDGNRESRTTMEQPGTQNNKS